MVHLEYFLEYSESSIIFVHGLQDHPRNTWTYTPPSSSRKPKAATEKNRLSIGKWVGAAFGRLHKQERTYYNGAIEPGNQVYWPQDLLP